MGSPLRREVYVLVQTKQPGKLNLKKQAYNILKHKLVYCEIPPGAMLNEAQLASELGFSRTPIREAISVLETEGYVRVVPKKGVLVTDILLSDVLQIFQVRMEIEPLAIKLASNSLPTDELLKWRQKFIENPVDIENGFILDTNMHMFIIERCNNTYIIEMMKKVFDKNTRIIISSNQNHSHIKEAHSEHIEILNSLISQDYDKAAVQMRTHVSHCCKAALDFFYTI